MTPRLLGIAVALGGLSLSLASCPAPGPPKPATSSLAILYAVYQQITPAGSFVASYTIAADGALTPIGGAASAGNGTVVATTPSGRFAYVTDPTPGVWVYHVNTLNGAVSPIASLPRSTLGTPSWMAADPSGKYLYVLTSLGSAKLDANVIDETTGSLSFLFSTSALSAPETFAVHPSGRFVYVTNGSSVVCIPVDPTTGNFGVASLFATGLLPVGVAITPDGRFLYVADLNGQKIYGYSIDQATGALNLLPTTPLATGGPSTWVAIDPKGRFLYSAEHGPPTTIHGYKIDPTTGALSAVPGSPLLLTGSGATVPAIDPSGQFLYAGGSYSSGNQFHAYRMDPSTGGLAELTASPYAISGATSITSFATASLTAPSP